MDEIPQLTVPKSHMDYFEALIRASEAPPIDPRTKDRAERQEKRRLQIEQLLEQTEAARQSPFQPKPEPLPPSPPATP